MRKYDQEDLEKKQDRRGHVLSENRKIFTTLQQLGLYCTDTGLYKLVKVQKCLHVLIFFFQYW